MSRSHGHTRERPLSRLQRAILTWVSGEAGAPDEPVIWHIPTVETMPPSLRPHASRSLRRLEARGLLRRLGPTLGPFAGRTVYVEITAVGVEIIKARSPSG